MLETILKLYAMAMAGDVRSPVPHLFGPPGCGKSWVVEQAAEIIGVNMHTINVSRLSPLEVEGVMMPQGIDEAMVLKMLHATHWTQLKTGDILFLDEFLRGFPEVYNALLDILTSRRVGSLPLPQVFIIAASNSTVAYDKALEDRLLHIPVADPRKDLKARHQLATLLVDELGLMPEMAKSSEMDTLLATEVLPMFEVLDSLSKKHAPPATNGSSVRNLIGQAKLRHVQCAELVELINMNNHRAVALDKFQYVLLLDGKHAAPKYIKAAPELVGHKALSVVQSQNLRANLELISMEQHRTNQGGEPDVSEERNTIDDLFN